MAVLQSPWAWAWTAALADRRPGPTCDAKRRWGVICGLRRYTGLWEPYLYRISNYKIQRHLHSSLAVQLLRWCLCDADAETSAILLIVFTKQRPEKVNSMSMMLYRRTDEPSHVMPDVAIVSTKTLPNKFGKHFPSFSCVPSIGRRHWLFLENA